MAVVPARAAKFVVLGLIKQNKTFSLSCRHKPARTRRKQGLRQVPSILPQYFFFRGNLSSQARPHEEETRTSSSPLVSPLQHWGRLPQLTASFAGITTTKFFKDSILFLFRSGKRCTSMYILRAVWDSSRRYNPRLKPWISLAFVHDGKNRPLSLLAFPLAGEASELRCAPVGSVGLGRI